MKDVLPATWMPDGMALITDREGRLVAAIIGDSFHVLTAVEQKEMEQKQCGPGSESVSR